MTRAALSVKPVNAAPRRDVKQLGVIGLQGWRRKVADAAAPALAGVTPLQREDARAWIGLAFVALSAWYVGVTAVRFLRST
jgi:hypothetical protein